MTTFTEETNKMFDDKFPIIPDMPDMVWREDVKSFYSFRLQTLKERLTEEVEKEKKKGEEFKDSADTHTGSWYKGRESGFSKAQEIIERIL